jgi:5'-3' exoribonuclease 1
MDCNSIIYDNVQLLEKIIPKLNLEEFEKRLVDAVIAKIEEYIRFISPTETVYIAFDGVAPKAKWEQQQSRRIRNTYLSSIKYGDETEETTPIFDKNKITPETDFMNYLSDRVEKHFNNSQQRYGVKTLIISSPNERGEGEHKLFDYIRLHKGEHLKDDVALYGLDSDLIMLSIFNIKYVNNIYIFREAPEFLRSSISLEIKLGETEPHFLDMLNLCQCILIEMKCKCSHPMRLYDYAFMCFFLGNDFLHGFPALNIRTHGLQVLMDMYRKHIGNSPEKSFIEVKTEKIRWDYVLSFIKELGKIERELLLREHSYRGKYDKWRFPESTPDEKRELVQNIPILYRELEKYICPTEKFWKERYEKVLTFGWNTPKTEEEADAIRNSIRKNYLEGLDWVYTYYTSGCKNWSYKSVGSMLLCSVMSSGLCLCSVLMCSELESEKKCSIYKRYIWEL